MTKQNTIINFGRTTDNIAACPKTCTARCSWTLYCSLFVYVSLDALVDELFLINLLFYAATEGKDELLVSTLYVFKDYFVFIGLVLS